MRYARWQGNPHIQQDSARRLCDQVTHRTDLFAMSKAVRPLEVSCSRSTPACSSKVTILKSPRSQGPAGFGPSSYYANNFAAELCCGRFERLLRSLPPKA